jgi:methyl-accepting chemotaxis protein
VLADLSLRNKYLIATFGSVILLSLSVILFARPLLERKLYVTLEKRGVTIASSIAFNAADYVLEEKYLLMTLMFKDYEKAENDIVYIFFSDEHDNVLAHTFDDGFPLDLKDINKIGTNGKYAIEHLSTERGDIVDIAVPLLKGQMGTLHVGISGEQIRQDVTSFVRSVMWLVIVILIAGGGIAIVASRLITRPIRRLSQAAAKVAAGDLDHRLEVSSHDEIGQLEMIFNDMIEKRKHREDEREELIAELREALAKVRTLSGMLPICASCKKIRDDKGYWTQIESYVRDHSEAEFSHGLCPECAKKMYPEYFKG